MRTLIRIGASAIYSSLNFFCVPRNRLRMYLSEPRTEIRKRFLQTSLGRPAQHVGQKVSTLPIVIAAWIFSTTWFVPNYDSTLASLSFIFDTSTVFERAFYLSNLIPTTLVRGSAELRIHDIVLTQKNSRFYSSLWTSWSQKLLKTGNQHKIHLLVAD